MCKKILVAVVLIACVCSVLVAQATPKKVLLAQDVNNFVSTYDAMDADFASLGDKYDNLIGDMEEGESLSSAITRARSIQAPAEITMILKKYGYGDNGFEKLMVITFGCSALAMDQAITEQTAGIEMTTEMKEYMDTARSQVTEMLSAIHTDDLALIRSKQDAITALLGTDEE